MVSGFGLHLIRVESRQGRKVPPLAEVRDQVRTRLVAQRLLTYANIVGRDRVMAASDCGFGTFAGYGAIHPPICYAKLASMAEGARMASEELWKKSS